MLYNPLEYLKFFGSDLLADNKQFTVKLEDQPTDNSGETSVTIPKPKSIREQIEELENLLPKTDNESILNRYKQLLSEKPGYLPIPTKEVPQMDNLGQIFSISGPLLAAMMPDSPIAKGAAALGTTYTAKYNQDVQRAAEKFAEDLQMWELKNKIARDQWADKEALFKFEQGLENKEKERKTNLVYEIWKAYQSQTQEYNKNAIDIFKANLSSLTNLKIAMIQNIMSQPDVKPDEIPQLIDEHTDKLIEEYKTLRSNLEILGESSKYTYRTDVKLGPNTFTIMCSSKNEHDGYIAKINEEIKKLEESKKKKFFINPQNQGNK